MTPCCSALVQGGVSVVSNSPPKLHVTLLKKSRTRLRGKSAADFDSAMKDVVQQLECATFPPRLHAWSLYNTCPRKFSLATALQHSVCGLDLCSMHAGEDGYYVVERSAALAAAPYPALGSLGASRDAAPSLDSLRTPAFLVRMPVVARNCSRMAQRAAAAGLALRPHVKT